MTYKIKLIAIAKDESAYLTEWIHHHFYFGIDAIHIAINNTTDGSTGLLDKLGRDFPVTYSIEDELSERHGAGFQGRAYIKMAKQAKEEGFTHVLMLDIDEFWVARDFQTSIKQAIDQIGEADSYLFHWFKHCSESEFSPCFKGKIIGGSAPLVKSLLSLESGYGLIREHNAYGDLCYKTAEGKDYFFDKENKTRIRIDVGRKLILQDLPFVVIHRMYRSQMEYVSLLVRGRPNGNLIKDNRHGYGIKKNLNDEFIVSQDRLCQYYDSLEEMVKNAGIREDIEKARIFVENRYKNALSVFNRGDLSQEDLTALKKVLLYVDIPEVFEIYKGLDERINQYKHSDLPVLNTKEVNFLRDLAIKMESLDLVSSLALMETALKFRPKGPLIKKKVAEYKELLESNN
ncbi:MAG: glycosyltransferase family 2 protein [Marinomonas sp.]